MPGSALNTFPVFISTSFLLVAAVGLGEAPGSAASWQLPLGKRLSLSEFQCPELENGYKNGTYGLLNFVVTG